MASLITGAGGFIGRALLRTLVERGEFVIALSRKPDPSRLETLVSWRPMPNSVTEWAELLRGVSTVYHLAWSTLPQTSNEDPPTDASDNIVKTLELLQAAKRQDNLRLVFASSGGTVYGALSSVPANEQHSTNPRCAYGVSKLAIEKYLAMYHDLWGLNGISLRIGNAYGPGQKIGRNFGAIATFAMHAVKGEPITIYGNGSVIRDYIYIDDLVDAIIAAGSHVSATGVINVAAGVGKSLNDIIDVLGKVCAEKIAVNYIQGRDLDVPISVLDISLASAVLNWRPRTSFETGIESTVKAFRTA